MPFRYVVMRAVATDGASGVEVICDVAMPVGEE
jgi:hypothetical protein